MNAMQGLILAGGEGTRLAQGGIGQPKPMVPLAGRPQVVRLVETMSSLGAEAITVMVRAPFVSAVEAGLQGAALLAIARVMECETPSSLHTLALGLEAAPPGPAFCSMVDTVMPAGDWLRVYRESMAALETGAALVLAVTGFVDDEKPLWVERDDAGFARRIGGAPVEPPCVTGGVYALGPLARLSAKAAVAQGQHRMREWLASFAAAGNRIATVEVSRIVDLDRVADLAEAERVLQGE